MIPRNNQFGGLTGSGTTHYLVVETWNEILETLDQDKATMNLISIDFQKAFNTISHAVYIEAFMKRNCDPHLVRLIRSFLIGRQSVYKIKKQYSTRRNINGGSPQGTLLGNFLFMIATEDLDSTESVDNIVNTTTGQDSDPEDLINASDREGEMDGDSPTRLREMALTSTPQ